MILLTLGIYPPGSHIPDQKVLFPGSDCPAGNVPPSFVWEAVSLSLLVLSLF